jgi:hypothetical protein
MKALKKWHKNPEILEAKGEAKKSALIIILTWSDEFVFWVASRKSQEHPAVTEQFCLVIFEEPSFSALVGMSGCYSNIRKKNCFLNVLQHLWDTTVKLNKSWNLSHVSDIF